MILNEGSRDNVFAQYIPLFQKRGIDANVSTIKTSVLNKLVVDGGFHNLSLTSNYYLAGVARYYFSGQLTANKQVNLLYPRVKDRFIPEICQRLDALILILRNSYIDSVGTQFEQPEDFGTLTVDKLLRKYNKLINKELGLDAKPVENKKPEVDSDTTAGKMYDYEILYSYEDAKKYNAPTEPGAWCITYGKQHYDAYIRRLGIHYVIFRRKGYENIPRKKGPNWTTQKPQDEYGNSLIAVLQSNKSPEPMYITSRWNHGTSSDGTSCEADHAYTKEEFLNVIGCDESVLQRCFDQWKANKPASSSANRSELYKKKLEILRNFKYIQMRINNGNSPIDIFDSIREFSQGAYDNDPKLKGVYLVGIQNEDSYHVAIMHNRHIVFQSIVSMDGYHDIRMSSIGYNDDIRSQNLYTFAYYSRQQNTWVTCMYSASTKSMIELEGNAKFKYTNYYQNFDLCAVANSGNQIGMVDINKGVLVKAPNGATVFEGIVNLSSHHNNNRDYSGQISLPRVWDAYETTVLKFIYDSSAEDIYYYDLRHHRFINIINDQEDKTTPSNRDSALSGTLQYDNEKLRSTYSFGDSNKPKEIMKFQSLETGQFINILGYDKFYYIHVSPNRDVIEFTPVTEDGYMRSVIYNMRLQKIVQYKNKKLILPLAKWMNPYEFNQYHIESFYDWKGYVRIQLMKNYNVFYNPYNDTFLNFAGTDHFQNPYNGYIDYKTKQQFIWNAKKDAEKQQKNAEQEQPVQTRLAEARAGKIIRRMLNEIYKKKKSLL